MEKTVILGLAAAAGAALIVLLAAWRPWRRVDATRPRAGAWGGVVACTLAWITGYLMVNHRPPPVPVEQGWQWLFFVCLAAGTIGLCGALLGNRPWISVPVFAIAAATMIPLPLPTAATIAGVAGLAVLTELLQRRRPGPVNGLALTIALAGAAAVVMFSGNEKLFRLLAGLAVAVALVSALGMRRPAICPGPGTSTLIVALLVGTVLSARFYSYSDISLWSYLLVCLAPLGLWAGEIPPLRRAHPVIGAAIRVAAVIVPTAVGVGMAIAVTETDIYYG